MKKFLLYPFIFSTIGCSLNEEILIPLEIESRNTIEELQDIPALLDVEEIVKGNEIFYFFSLELQGSTQKERLVPGKDNLICDLLNEQLIYGMSITENCELEGYYLRYLRPGSAPANYRLHVTISGEVKERHPNDLFTGLPFSLNDIQKIKSCPIELQANQETISLENNFWKLIGFTDENGTIISSPTCEDPDFGIIFYDRLLAGFPMDDPEARTFSIKSRVYFRPDQFFLVYAFSSKNTIFITRALSPSWMPPRPATAPTNNLSSLTKDISNKYDSLSKIFRFNEETSFSLQGNTLMLRNPASGINALFVHKWD